MRSPSLALLCFVLFHRQVLSSCFTHSLLVVLFCFDFALLYFDALTSARVPDQHQEVQLALLLPLVPLHPLLPEKHRTEGETAPVPVQLPVQSGSVTFNQIKDGSDGSGGKVQAKLDLLTCSKAGAFFGPNRIAS